MENKQASAILEVSGKDLDKQQHKKNLADEGHLVIQLLFVLATYNQLVVILD